MCLLPETPKIINLLAWLAGGCKDVAYNVLGSECLMHCVETIGVLCCDREI